MSIPLQNLLIKSNHILVIKRKIPCKHYIENNTTGPYVRHRAIVTFVQKDLWGYVVRAATRGMQQTVFPLILWKGT
uniref:Uncharacterized protein n=1 Tax=Arundo donax TaxID=35708 RepID=A0A0A9D3H7_ARUDO